MGSKIPNGLQQHVLWNMDGRQWIERLNPERLEMLPFQRCVERGWAKIIPQDKLSDFVNSL